MIIENLFENVIYPALKQYVESKSIYGPLVTKKKPQESKKFPIVPVKLLDSTNTYSTLNYSEETFDFGIEIEIYAIETSDATKRKICNEVTNKVVDFFKENLKVTLKIELDVPNVDSNVHRNKVKVTGKVDSKYGLDKLKIYPR